VTEADFIKTATIPLIKAKFAPKFCPSHKHPRGPFDSLLIIDVDISIDDASNPYHRGIQQSEYVSNTVNSYQFLKPVCLILKRLLA